MYGVTSGKVAYEVKVCILFFTIAFHFYSTLLFKFSVTIISEVGL